jgi:predicted negative regulator of RcsB-dependent stress response
MLNMKCLLNITLLLFSTQVFALNTSLIKEALTNNIQKTNRGQFEYPKNQSELEGLDYYRKLKANQTIQSNLAAIKYQIINGNLERAKMMLLQSKYSDGYSKVIQFRYLSIIHFIQGNYEKSLSFLTKEDMYNISFEKNICLLRTLNYLILNKVNLGNTEWNRCVNATLGKSPTSHLWMTTLVKLKLNDEKNITNIPLKNINIENETGDFLRLFLKLALYLNKQGHVLSRIQYMNTDNFKDPQIRELIGLLYYRNGNILNSFRFVEDLNSPNAENIKGNIFLTQKKYELAYAQYKLALNKKINSRNSLERIIPVAWLLKQWDDGYNYVDRLAVDPKDLSNKLTIKAAFLTQQKKYKEAKKVLTKIVIGSRNSQSPEVNQLFSYNAMMLKDLTLTNKYSDQACKNLDGVNCWLQFQLNTWENFPLTLQRDGDISSNNSDLLDEYTSAIKKDSLEEDVYVNQVDIEELDNNIIRLLPNYQSK